MYLSFFSGEVVGPSAAGAFKERPARPTSFRKFYERGDFPIALEHDTKGNHISWKVLSQIQQTGECSSLKCSLHGHFLSERNEKCLKGSAVLHVLNLLLCGSLSFRDVIMVHHTLAAF